MKPSSLLRGCLGMVALLTLSTAAGAGPLDSSCVLGPQPAASLLLPYFEVDLGASTGVTTLMSIGNRSLDPTLARVTLWSDWAIPVYAFDLLLPGRGLQTLNLRDVVGRGRIPVTGDDITPVGSCTVPLTNPPLDSSALVGLQTQLTGKKSVGGLCWGSDRGDSSVAVGYVTVDVLTDCSDTVRYPSDEGYFAADGTGLAGYDNVLYGDWFLIDPSQDLAQGAELVHLVADRAFFKDQPRSFYRVFTDDPTADGRVPLSGQWQTRFLNGGGFDGGTELLLWQEPLVPTEPLPCGESPQNDLLFTEFIFHARTEAGTGLTLLFFETGDAFVHRVNMDESTLPEDFTSGLLEITSAIHCGVCSPPFGGYQQSWLVPLFSASNRFSVGTGAIRLNDLCIEP